MKHLVKRAKTAINVQKYCGKFRILEMTYTIILKVVKLIFQLLSKQISAPALQNVRLKHGVS